MDKVLNNLDLIDGLQIVPLKKISDQRGMVLHMLRSATDKQSCFGEIYFSLVYKNCVKAWKKHYKMTQNLAVPSGHIKLVCYDDRSNSKTFGKINEVFLGREDYKLIKIPPLIWYGFYGIEESLIANCADMLHDPLEIERKIENDTEIPYCWLNN